MINTRDKFPLLGPPGNGRIEGRLQDQFGLLARIQVTKVPEKWKESDIPWQVQLNWLQVSQSVNAGPLPHSGGQERETLAVPSEQCMARSGSEYDEMGMIPARFACVLQRRTRCLNMHFLSIFQEVEPINSRFV